GVSIGGAPLVIKMVPDGSGGAMAVWKDGGLIASNAIGVFARRITGAGVPQGATYTQLSTFVATGAIDLSLAITNPVVATSDGSQGLIAAWSTVTSTVSGDIIMQRMLPNTSLPWGGGGVTVAGGSGAQTVPDIAPDGTGGAVAAWLDVRIVGTDVYA